MSTPMYMEKKKNSDKIISVKIEKWSIPEIDQNYIPKEPETVYLVFVLRIIRIILRIYYIYMYIYI